MILPKKKWGMILPLFFPISHYHFRNPLTSVASRYARADATVMVAGAEQQHIAPAARDTSTADEKPRYQGSRGGNTSDMATIIQKENGDMRFVSKDVVLQ